MYWTIKYTIYYILYTVNVLAPYNTRLHTRRMCTTHTLTISPNMLCARGVSAAGVSAVGGVCSSGMSTPKGCLLQEGVCSQGTSAVGGCLLWGGGIPACTEADISPVSRITHTCENITLPQLHCGW